jgi:hypothetical protein
VVSGKDTMTNYPYILFNKSPLQLRELGARRVQFQMQFDYPRSNPPVRDRVNSVNAMLKNAGGDIRTRVHPDCKELYPVQASPSPTDARLSNRQPSAPG